MKTNKSNERLSKGKVGGNQHKKNQKINNSQNTKDKDKDKEKDKEKDKQKQISLPQTKKREEQNIPNLFKITLISSKLPEGICLAEERILQMFVNSNSSHFNLNTIHTSPQNISQLFKQYPILYLNGILIDAKTIIYFIYSILFPQSPNKEHFEYLMLFLYGEFRFLYQDTLIGKNLNSSSHSIQRDINIPETINSFYDYFSDKKEKEFIYFIMFAFISEYKSIINLKGEANAINFNSKIEINKYNNKSVLNEFIIDSDNIEELINENLAYFAMEMNNNSEQKGEEIEDIEVDKNWKNSLFSLTLFAGFTGLLYLVSICNSKS